MIQARPDLQYYFSSFIHPTPKNNKLRFEVNMEVSEASDNLFKEIVRFGWQDWSGPEQKPLNYRLDLIETLDQYLVGEAYFPLKHHYANGELSDAIKNLRIVESALNFEWKELMEPSQFYESEIAMYLHITFRDLIHGLKLYPHTIDQLEEALLLSEYWSRHPGGSRNFGLFWSNLITALRAELADESL